jgi:hypothetical protein
MTSDRAPSGGKRRVSASRASLSAFTTRETNPETAWLSQKLEDEGPLVGWTNSSAATGHPMMHRERVGEVFVATMGLVPRVGIEDFRLQDAHVRMILHE